MGWQKKVMHRSSIYRGFYHYILKSEILVVLVYCLLLRAWLVAAYCTPRTVRCE